MLRKNEDSMISSKALAQRTEQSAKMRASSGRNEALRESVANPETSATMLNAEVMCNRSSANASNVVYAAQPRGLQAHWKTASITKLTLPL